MSQDVFIVHSPFQLFIAEHIVRTMPGEVTPDRWLLLESWGSTPVWQPELWTRTTLLSPPLGGSARRNGAARRRVLRMVTEEFRSCESARLWLANVQWPLNNLLYRELSSCTLANTCHYNFPEGIGSLLCPRPDLRQHVRDFAKMATRFIGGSGYQPFSCDLMGVSTADKVFTLCKEFVSVTATGEVVQIPRLKTGDDGHIDNTLIFVGQNYDDHLPDSLYRRLCEGAAAYGRNLGTGRMLYKPHHYASTTTEQDILEQYGFERLDWAGPIETYMAQNPPKYVLSYNSSALVHAKLLLGRRVEAIAYGANEIQKYLRQDRDTAARMKRLFDLCGVHQITTSRGAAAPQLTGMTADVREF